MGAANRNSVNEDNDRRPIFLCFIHIHEYETTNLLHDRVTQHFVSI